MPETFHRFPILTTSRLVLRQLNDDDLRAIFELRSNPIVCRYIARPIAQHIDEAKDFIERIKKGYAGNSSYYWVISPKDSDELMGTVCLWNFSGDRTIAETGYEMLPGYHNKGYMKEALAAVCGYGFNILKLAAIEAFMHGENTSSRNLLERSGFVLCEGRMDEDVEANVVYRKNQQQ